MRNIVVGLSLLSLVALTGCATFIACPPGKISAPVCAPATPGYWDVAAFGAKADGETDDTAALQAALDEAGKTGGVVRLASARYLVKGCLNVPSDVTLEGTWRTPARAADSKGSLLLAVAGKGESDGKPFITLNTDSTLKGLSVLYPEQVATEEPIPYPWTVRGAGDNCTLRDVLLLNPYQAVDFGTNPCGRHYINGLYAQALYKGLFVDKCYDVGRVENVHFWPFWKDEKALQKFTSEKGTAFIFGRTDWEFVENSFCIFYNVGFLFKGFKDGPGNVVVTSSGSDIGPCAVRVEDVQGHAGVTFVNCQFMSAVEVLPTNTGPVKFTASGFWPIDTTSAQARLSGAGQVFFEGCHFSDWDKGAAGVACIEADCAGLTVSGCDFMAAGKKQIRLGPNVGAAMIMANRFRGGQSLQNGSKGDVQIGLNAQR